MKRKLALTIAVCLVIGLLMAGAADAQGPFTRIRNLYVSIQAVIVGPLSVDGGAQIAGPTAAATATPALLVNNAGAGNVILEVQKASTPWVRVQNSGESLFLNGVYVNAPTAIASATPALMVNSLGVSNLFEVRDASTPVVQVYNGGAVHLVGDLDGAGASFTSGSIAGPTAIGTATPALYINNAGVSDQIAIADGGVVAFQMYNGGGAKFAAPTAIGTAVPGLIVDSLGVSNIFEVRDAATPVVQVYNGGAVHLTGNIDGAGASFTSGSIAAPTAVGTATPALYINNAGVSDQIAIADGGVVAFQMYNGGGAKFAAPTAIGTAVPGLIVDSLGVSNILEVRDAATPVFAVENGGTVNGLVLKYAVANTSVVFGTATFSASKTVATGLTSATFCMCSPKSDFAGDTGWCTASPSSGNVVLKLWKINSTPTATTVDQDVTWVCIGI